MSREITRTAVYCYPPQELKELIEATWAGKYNDYLPCELLHRHRGDCQSYKAHVTLLDAISIIADDRQEFIQAMREVIKAYLPIVLRGPEVKLWGVNAFVRWNKDAGRAQLKELREKLSQRAGEFAVTESVSWEEYNDLGRLISSSGIDDGDDFKERFEVKLKNMLEEKPVLKVHAPNMPLEWYAQADKSLDRLAEGKLPFSLTPHMSIASGVRHDKKYDLTAKQVAEKIRDELPKVPMYAPLLGQDVVHEVNDAYIVEPSPTCVVPIEVTVLDRITGKERTELRHIWSSRERLPGSDSNEDSEA